MQPRFPYAKSVIASFGLFVAMLVLLTALTDPKSGEIRPSAVPWLLVGGLPAAIIAVFYAESRGRKKSQQSQNGGASRTC
jgi:hypothetical protein